MGTGGRWRGHRSEFDLSDSSLRTPIESISIFDSRCAQIYVDEENQIAFVPSVIRVLVRLAEEQMTIQGEVEALVATAMSRKPNFTVIPTGTKARGAVDSLTAKSEQADLALLATLSEADIARRNGDRFFREFVAMRVRRAQQQSQLSPRQLLTPSFAATPAITSAATGSAHHQPASAFASRPTSSAIER